MLTATLLLLLGTGSLYPSTTALPPTFPIGPAATADTTHPAVPLVLPVPGTGGKLLTVVLPGQRPQVVPADKLGDFMANYTEGFTTQITQPYGPSPVNRSWGGQRDGISGEVESLLGEAENSIMQGIGDEVENLAGQALGSILDVSPVSEVARLRTMMKDGFSKQQKMAYQDLKIDYAWRKAHTELSSSFVDYYNALDIQSKFKWVSTQSAQCERALASSWLTTKETDLYRGNVRELATVDDLSTDVKTACNQGSSAVWMAESERIAVLDAVVAELHQRAVALQRIQQTLRTAVVHRKKSAAENTVLRSLYRSNTKLNRTVNTLSTR